LAEAAQARESGLPSETPQIAGQRVPDVRFIQHMGLNRGLLAVLCVMGLVLVAGCSPVRVVEAAGLLSDVARPDAPAQRSRITYAGVATAREGDLYRPARARAALVLVPGATEAALDDPRLQSFAEALRRRDLVVLIPALDGDNPLQVSASDVDAVADGIRYLTQAGQFAQIGIAAPSYAAGPAILAALQDDLRDRVGFVVAIGGYYDITEAITYLTTGAFRESAAAPWRRGAVNERARWLFLQANTDRMDNRRDAATLAGIAGLRLRDPQADTRDLAARLGGEGRDVYRLFTNRDPEAVPRLIDALPPRFAAEIRALDLSARDLSLLQGDLILIHGRDDPLVPYTESLRLAQAAGPERVSVHLLDDLDHVDIGAPGPGDLGRMLSAAYAVLAARDSVARQGLRQVAAAP
jgi:fermentation-respiration switch protein FrsA (DUF1100 family)